MAIETDPKPDPAAAVGYRRPPTSTQFKKGQSGNPRGRPPKAKGARAIAERVLSEPQRLAGQPRGARVVFAVLELVVMTVKQMAASGHAQATALYSKFAQRHSRQQSEPVKFGFLIVPETLTDEEWDAIYKPKDGPPPDDSD